MSLDPVIDLIGQRSRDTISRLSVKGTVSRYF